MSKPREATVAAYQADAAAYAEGTRHLPDTVHRDIAAFAARLGAGARVLEIGSGSGRDARALEAAGIVVRRTDITPAFVALMRAEGHDADVVDPLTDDLGGPWDGVWSSAALLHADRGELATVLARLAAVTRVGGCLYASLKEGDGEGWSTHGHVTAPRHFYYWREAPLRAVLDGAGWAVDSVARTESPGDHWLDVVATRRG
jgi:SAM-dependent methyltransferase